VAEWSAPKAHPPRAGNGTNMYYVYILFSAKLKKKYIGYCQDLKERIISHNKGENQYTKKGRPWKLIYYEAFTSKTDAIREELFLKSGKGRERLKYLLRDTLSRL